MTKVITQHMDQEPPQKGNLCVLIVTYHPDQGFGERTNRILDQVGHVVIVDNASGEEPRLMLRKLGENDKIQLIENEKNVGIASALNQGMRWITGRRYAWTLTLDQDSIPFESMVERLSEAYHDYNRKDRIAVIGSNYCDVNNDKRIRFALDARTGRNCVEKTTVITSGCLLRVAAFEIIGPFRDAFFIDHVDHEYCLRALSRGFKVILGLKPTMKHTIGTRTKQRFGGLTVEITSHSAERCYYKSRNHVAITHEYFLKEPIWVLKLLILKIGAIISVCLYENEKASKMKSIIQGYRDGIMNVYKGRMQCL